MKKRSPEVERLFAEDEDLNWLDIADAYKATKNWSLVAQANAITVKELEARFVQWTDRPKRAATLKVWASMLEAEKEIELCKIQSAKAETGGRAEKAFLKDIQSREKELSDFQPRCCAASIFFMQGVTISEVEKVMGTIKCDKAAECREKCITLASTIVRQSMLQAATEGNVRAQMYLGDTVLHMGAEGNTSFVPTRLVFTPEAMSIIEEEENKDDERRLQLAQ